MLVKTKQNRMVKTTRNFEIFDEIRVDVILKDVSEAEIII